MSVGATLRSRTPLCPARSLPTVIRLEKLVTASDQEHRLRDFGHMGFQPGRIYLPQSTRGGDEWPVLACSNGTTSRTHAGKFEGNAGWYVRQALTVPNAPSVAKVSTKAANSSSKQTNGYGSAFFPQLGSRMRKPPVPIMTSACFFLQPCSSSRHTMAISVRERAADSQC